jgi:dephospho-CoA kinase
MTITIGLTGGIAMGKTTVSNHLANHHGLTVLDADQYAHQAVTPGSPILQQIVDRYSPSILQSDGTLDRPQLGDRIFNDRQERQWLEAQIHPFVRASMVHDRDQAHQTHPNRPVILVVPLLLETGMTNLVDTVWVITCPPEQQLARLIARNGLTETAAQARIASQMPIAEKIAQADLVLDNSSTVENLVAQVDRAVAITYGQSETTGTAKVG